MTIEILEKAVPKPPRIVLYGPEGVGKTTFGTQLPRPFFICSEGGADQFDVKRVNIKNSDQVVETFQYLSKNMESFDSIVIDSIDWLEEMIADKVAKSQGKRFVEDIGFGKGWAEVKREVKDLLNQLDYFINNGKVICLIAHSEVKKFHDPDLQEPYDRYTLKCNKSTTPLYKEWSDCLFFVNFTRDIIDGKSVGTPRRLVNSNHHPAMDGKNRFNIPDGIELNFNNFTPYFNNTNTTEGK